MEQTDEANEILRAAEEQGISMDILSEASSYLQLPHNPDTSETPLAKFPQEIDALMKRGDYTNAIKEMKNST